MKKLLGLLCFCLWGCKPAPIVPVKEQIMVNNTSITVISPENMIPADLNEPELKAWLDERPSMANTIVKLYFQPDQRCFQRGQGRPGYQSCYSVIEKDCRLESVDFYNKQLAEMALHSRKLYIHQYFQTLKNEIAKARPSQVTFNLLAESDNHIVYEEKIGAYGRPKIMATLALNDLLFNAICQDSSVPTMVRGSAWEKMQTISWVNALVKENSPTETPKQ